MAKNVPNVEVVVRGSKAELEEIKKFGLVFETQAKNFFIALIGGKWILFEVEEA